MIKRKRLLFYCVLVSFILLNSCRNNKGSTTGLSTDSTSATTFIISTTTTEDTRDGCDEDNQKYTFSENIEYVRLICQVTGENTINKTYTRFRFSANKPSGNPMNGTDLGIPVWDGEKMLIFFGDTFDGYNSFWRSNIVGFSNDFRLDDGLYFDDFLKDERTNAVLPVIEGNHNRDNEVTKIPTGGIHINGATYMFYMSVNEWEYQGITANWRVNYNGVVKSTDGGRTWKVVPSLRWMEDVAPNFAQIFPVQDKNNPNMIYIYGIQGGRHHGVQLGRVHKDKFENMDEYEYFTGLDSNNDPIWVKGFAGLNSIKEDALNDDGPSIILGPKVGELSVIYNEYLGKWMMTYGGTPTSNGVVYHTADNHWGPWSEQELLINKNDFHAVYGAFMHEKYTKENGRVVYFLMSQYNPLYDVYLFEVKFK